ncbi:pilus assembly protein PilP [Chitiniphilus purpureus]|uniref:Pilus assembly protein PilP n=1 Tax=Chitiniphilus purpureus TaxID=2981137 RepID=A0ABY6DP08_9NEIS|nr:pilus assembly protein PilP [Chitiniphilus sp. CD1]UXY16109.1 pilus assembly protein PilP [Chitiniphilus sp. CD1]
MSASQQILREACGMARWIPVAMFAVLLTGCFGEEHGDLKEWMAQNSEGLRGKIEPAPEVKIVEPVVYEAFSLLDPFNAAKMELAKKSSSGIAPNTNRPKEVLENYDLEKLRMVGILQQGKQIQALISAPDRNLYRVKVGNYMGQNFGMVVAISETEVKLKEIVEDSGGDWIERETILTLDEAEQN